MSAGDTQGYESQKVGIFGGYLRDCLPKCTKNKKQKERKKKRNKLKLKLV